MRNNRKKPPTNPLIHLLQFGADTYIEIFQFLSDSDRLSVVNAFGHTAKCYDLTCKGIDESKLSDEIENIDLMSGNTALFISSPFGNFSECIIVRGSKKLVYCAENSDYYETLVAIASEAGVEFEIKKLPISSSRYYAVASDMIWKQENRDSFSKVKPHLTFIGHYINSVIGNYRNKATEQELHLFEFLMSKLRIATRWILKDKLSIYKQIANLPINEIHPLVFKRLGEASSKCTTAKLLGVMPFFMEKKGEIICWGENQSGSLCVGDFDDKNYPIAKNNLLTKIIADEDGIENFFLDANTGFILTGDNNWYCWGSNSCAKLGLGDINHGENYSVATPIKNEKLTEIVFSGDKITRFIRRGASYFIQTGNKKYYLWGDSEHGLLGNEDQFIVHEPDRNKYLIEIAQKEAGLSDVFVGRKSVVVITGGNNCFCFGKTNLSFPDMKSYEYPEIPTKSPSITKIVRDEEGIKQAFIADDHTFIITGSKKCFCWGYNYSGQLGLDKIPTLDPVDEPTENKHLTHIIKSEGGIAAFYGRYNYTFIVTGIGNCYCCGSNKDNLMGFGSDHKRYKRFASFCKHEELSQILTSERGIIKFFTQERFVCILTGTGKWFSWGHNHLKAISAEGGYDTYRPIEVLSSKNSLQHSMKRVAQLKPKLKKCDVQELNKIEDDMYRFFSSTSNPHSIAEKQIRLSIKVNSLKNKI